MICYPKGKNFTVIIIMMILFIFSVSNTGIIRANSNPLWASVGGPYYANVDEPILFFLDIEGGMLPYYHYWDFGDGATSTLRFPTHSYNHSGIYSVSVTVVDGEGTRVTEYASAYIFKNLSVDLDEKYVVFTNETIEIQAAVSGGISPYNYFWDIDNDGLFDDSTGETLALSFAKPGSVYIALRVIDEIDNIAEDFSLIQVNVENTPPDKPSTPVGITKGRTGKNYSYRAIAYDDQGDDLFALWDWGNGNYSGWIGPFNSGDEITHSYQWPLTGTYEVRLKVRDTEGAESEWSEPLQISMPHIHRLYLDFHQLFFFFKSKIVFAPLISFL